MLGLKSSATRCLRVHSAVGSDPEHVRDIADYFVSSETSDRQAILEAVFEASTKFFDFPWCRVTDRTFVDRCMANGIEVPHIWTAGLETPALAGA